MWDGLLTMARSMHLPWNWTPWLQFGIFLVPSVSPGVTSQRHIIQSNRLEPRVSQLSRLSLLSSCRVGIATLSISSLKGIFCSAIKPVWLDILCVIEFYFTSTAEFGCGFDSGQHMVDIGKLANRGLTSGALGVKDHENPHSNNQEVGQLQEFSNGEHSKRIKT
ncbi:hypothetical protein L1987_16156 [Smallanthus sonchifolius]|uniref:Uncharacterized protein n=1 Tax=Smallanthus sonchifolius TaxID=185202 RepID=A0ACB9J7K0_9ASTR|nr:hypothetical protein L1987_16156 [Smallanthus sonchifolius]